MQLATRAVVTAVLAAAVAVAGYLGGLPLTGTAAVLALVFALGWPALAGLPFKPGSATVVALGGVGAVAVVHLTVDAALPAGPAGRVRGRDPAGVRQRAPAARRAHAARRVGVRDGRRHARRGRRGRLGRDRPDARRRAASSSSAPWRWPSARPSWRCTCSPWVGALVTARCRGRRGRPGRAAAPGDRPPGRRPAGPRGRRPRRHAARALRPAALARAALAVARGRDPARSR